MIFECWKEEDEDGDELSFFSECNNSARATLGSNAQLQYKIEAPTYEAAKREHFIKQGWKVEKIKMKDRLINLLADVFAYIVMALAWVAVRALRFYDWIKGKNQ